MSNKAVLHSFLETHFSPDAVRAVKTETMRIESGAHITSELGLTHSDLLISFELSDEIAVSGKRIFIYFLLEHKSVADPLTVFQVLGYNIRIWDQWIREHSGLTPVVPMVIYHGEQAWNSPRSLEDLIQSPPVFASFQVKYEIPIIDLSQMSDSEIEGNPVLQAAFMMLKYCRSKLLVEKLPQILESVAISKNQIDVDEWVEAIGVYAMSVNKDLTPDGYKQTVASVFPTLFEPGSLADRLLSQGRDEGKVEGKIEGKVEGEKEGIKKGKLTGKVQLLQELLGEPVSTDEELETKSPSDLQKWVSDLQKRLRERNS